MKKYDRNELISLCEKAIVPEEKWLNRDSASACKNIGTALAYLKAGCEFEVITEENENKNRGIITNEETIWVRIKIKGFSYFENIWDDDYDFRDVDIFYIPTEKRLNNANGNDWY